MKQTKGTPETFTSPSSKANKRWWHALAAGCLLVLIAANTMIIFDQEWSFYGFPHNYLYSALAKYYERDLAQPTGDNLFWEHKLNNVDLFPLYPLATLFGKVGAPEPSWFRLPGLVLLFFVFWAAYWLLPPPVDLSGRLLAALIVVTTPMVMIQSCYFEDHLLHTLYLLVGAGILLRSLREQNQVLSWLFFLLPALDLATTLMFTNFLEAGICFAGMYLVHLFQRCRLHKWPAVLLEESPKWFLALAALVAVALLRYGWSELAQSIQYYGAEASGHEKHQTTLLGHLFTYPRILAVSVAGAVPFLLSPFSVMKRFRNQHTALFWGWLLLPLAIMTAIGKKEASYIFYIGPAVAFLAYGFIAWLPSKIRPLLIAGLLVLGIAQSVDFHYHRLTNVVGQAPVSDGGMATFLKNSESRQLVYKRAEDVLAVAEKCGPLKGRPLLVTGDPPLEPFSEMIPTYFALLSLSREPVYKTLIHQSTAILHNLILVEPSLNRMPEQNRDFNQEFFALSVQSLEQLHKRLPLTYQDNEFRVYCRK